MIEDDPDARANLRDILELDNCVVKTAGSMSEVLSLPSLAEVGVIILDRRLPDGNALDFLPTLRAHAPAAAVVIVTARSDLEGAIDALRLGAADYILKPYSAASLRLRIGRLLEQQRLALAKERGDSVFRNLVEAAECLIVMIRPDDHGILYFSPFAEQLTGHRADEVLRKSFLELTVPRSEQAGFIARCHAALKGKPQREIQSKLLCRDGSCRIVLRNIRCLPDYDGSPALLIVANDITELKRAQEHALQSERMAAIGQMCAGLAHESRNALQRSQACLEMLALKLEDRPDSLNLINRIQQAQDDLHRLYEDVREYAAPIKLGVVRCDLAEIWLHAWQHLEPLHSARQATLHEATGGLDLSCEADPFRLEQVFRNILDNALAACTERPEITISAIPVSLEGREAIRLAIRDNGPGLSAEQRARMFESFYTTKTRGTGLGLAIVRRIIEAHGGRVGLGESRRKGAEIILTLPRQQEG
ncbi:MAG: response regulator [Planctomycetaceae bacterium]|nr:response regulator [Planctomycetaceae bacterium]